MMRYHFEITTIYSIDGVQYLYQQSDDHGACFKRKDKSGALEFFTWKDLDEIIGTRRWDIHSAAKTPRKAKVSHDDFAAFLEKNSPAQRCAVGRWLYADVLHEERLKNDQKLSDKALQAAMSYLDAQVVRREQEFEEKHDSGYFSSKAPGGWKSPSPRTLRKWYRRYIESGRAIEVFADLRGAAKGRRGPAERNRFIRDQLKKKIKHAGPGNSAIVKDTIQCLKEENARRASIGLDVWPIPCESGLHRWFDDFDQFELTCIRDGVEEAKKRSQSFGRAPVYIRPMQCVQFDEWEIHLLSFLTDRPIAQFIPSNLIKQIPKGRRWLYCARDVATGCIVGLRLAATPNSEDAVKALRMCTIDKTSLARAAGAKHRWDQYGGLESVQKDDGPAFRSLRFKKAMFEAHGVEADAPSGMKNARAALERTFGVFETNCMPNLPGRTCSNPQAKGNYDAVKMTSLTDDQLIMYIIRYVVDVYNQRPKASLFGDSPATAWTKGCQFPGKVPDISPKAQRRAFGLRVTHKIGREGLRFLGIKYTCKEIQQVYAAKSYLTATFYVDPKCLGEISVLIDGVWFEARCSSDNWYGVTLYEWREAAKRIRNRHAKTSEIAEATALRTITEIRSAAWQNAEVVGVTPQDAREEDIARARKQLFHGLRVVADQDETEFDDDDDDGFGEVVVSFDSSEENGRHVQSSERSDAFDDDEDLWGDD